VSISFEKCSQEIAIGKRGMKEGKHLIHGTLMGRFPLWAMAVNTHLGKHVSELTRIPKQEESGLSTNSHSLLAEGWSWRC
jgi:hypothetical protein